MSGIPARGKERQKYWKFKIILHYKGGHGQFGLAEGGKQGLKG